jgi:hypothetical protein
MTRPLRSLIAAALLAPALAAGQTTTTVIGVPPSLQVERLAPQLVLFAGGQTNFDSLVNGLGLGSPVTLTTVLPNGQVQLVNFTPQGTMTATQIAQTLEAARQNLISLGIATPTAQQVAITLTGGTLPTSTGSTQVTALLPAANLPVPVTPAATGGTSTVTTTTNPPNGNPSPAALIQGQAGAGGTTPPSPAQLIQNQRSGNISDTPIPGVTGTTPTPSATAPSPAQAPGVPLAPSVVAPTRSAPLAPAR